MRTLFERYGTRAEAVAAFINRELDESLKSLPHYSHREVAFLAQHEKIVHLDDLVLRRSMIAMLGHLSEDGLNELADALGESLGWTGEQKKAEVTRTLSILANRHGVRF